MLFTPSPGQDLPFLSAAEQADWQLIESRLTTANGSGDEPAAPLETSAWCMSRGKRCLDIAVAAPALLALTPLMALIACGIRLTSSGPAIFRQRRVGVYGTPFVILKFRTMTHCEPGTPCGPSVTREGDPRTTRMGSLLRRFKLDELPQLVNILRGEMSLIGPRPKLAQHEKMYLTCRPGLTGAATIVFSQEEYILANVPEMLVEDYAVSVLNPIKVLLDTRYVENATILTDLRILAGTVFSTGRAALFPSLAALGSEPTHPDELAQEQLFT